MSPGLRTAFAYVELPYLKVASRDELFTARQGRERDPRRWAARMLEKLDARRNVSGVVSLSVHAWRLGSEMLVIGMGAETVVDYALRFKKEFGPGTWVCGYADDMIAYIPSRRVWEEGGYEGGLEPLRIRPPRLALVRRYRRSHRRDGTQIGAASARVNRTGAICRPQDKGRAILLTRPCKAEGCAHAPHRPHSPW